MSDFKFNLPTASSLYTAAKKDYDTSFRKKAIEVGLGSPSSGAFEKNNAGVRVQYQNNKQELMKSFRENQKALRKSNLSAEQKEIKDKELIDQLNQIEDKLKSKYDEDFIEISKPKKSVKKKTGGTVATKKKKVSAKKKPQSGHNRLY